MHLYLISGTPFSLHAAPTPSPSLCSSLLHSQVQSTFQQSIPSPSHTHRSLFTCFTLPIHPQPTHHESMHPSLHTLLAPLFLPSTTLLCSSLPSFLIASFPILLPFHSSCPPPLQPTHYLSSLPSIIPPLLPSILSPNLLLIHPPLLHSLLQPTSLLLSSRPPT